MSADEKPKGPLAEVRVARMGPVTMSDGKPGFGMTLTGAREVIHRMAEASVTFFEGEGGVNYVEFTVHHDTKGSFVHRIQRLEGKTPHELRREAEKRAEKAEAERGHWSRQAEEFRKGLRDTREERDLLRTQRTDLREELNRAALDLSAARAEIASRDATLAALRDAVARLERLPQVHAP